jgi:hypothetical protein
LIAAREDIVLDMARAKAGLPANLRRKAFKRMLLDLGHYVTSPGPGRWESAHLTNDFDLTCLN